MSKENPKPHDGATGGGDGPRTRSAGVTTRSQTAIQHVPIESLLMGRPGFDESAYNDLWRSSMPFTANQQALIQMPMAREMNDYEDPDERPKSRRRLTQSAFSKATVQSHRGAGQTPQAPTPRRPAPTPAPALAPQGVDVNKPKRGRPRKNATVAAAADNSTAARRVGNVPLASSTGASAPAAAPAAAPANAIRQPARAIQNANAPGSEQGDSEKKREEAADIAKRRAEVIRQASQRDLANSVADLIANAGQDDQNAAGGEQAHRRRQGRGEIVGELFHRRLVEQGRDVSGSKDDDEYVLSDDDDDELATGAQDQRSVEDHERPTVHDPFHDQRDSKFIRVLFRQLYSIDDKYILYILCIYFYR